MDLPSSQTTEPVEGRGEMAQDSGLQMPAEPSGQANHSDGARRWIAWIVAAVVIVVLILSGYFFFSDYNLGSDEPFASYEKLMEADTSGGTTPEETLRLFVEALRAEDVERAASYFLLDENGSREVWENGLAQAKEEGRLQEIVDEVERAQPRSEGAINENDFKYVILDDVGSVKRNIDMELNTYSNVWKIESL